MHQVSGLNIFFFVGRICNGTGGLAGGSGGLGGGGTGAGWRRRGIGSSGDAENFGERLPAISAFVPREVGDLELAVIEKFPGCFLRVRPELLALAGDMNLARIAGHNDAVGGGLYGSLGKKTN